MPSWKSNRSTAVRGAFGSAGLTGAANGTSLVASVSRMPFVLNDVWSVTRGSPVRPRLVKIWTTPLLARLP